KTFPQIEDSKDVTFISDYDTFMVVRHPFERLLYYYNSKFEYAGNISMYIEYGERMVKEYRTLQDVSEEKANIHLKNVRNYIKSLTQGSQPLPQTLINNPYAQPLGPTFEEFLRFVIDPNKKDSKMWMPMHLSCSLCTIDYNFVLKFEDFTYESLDFLDNIGIMPDRNAFDYLPSLDGPIDPLITCKYFQKIGLEIIKNLIVKYHNDILLFDYDVSYYLECIHKASVKL
ncbi:unnamed protein product, partial [Meganyctiphanes norvegica]